jgi:hypothetical protein
MVWIVNGYRLISGRSHVLKHETCCRDKSLSSSSLGIDKIEYIEDKNNLSFGITRDWSSCNRDRNSCWGSNHYKVHRLVVMYVCSSKPLPWRAVLSFDVVWPEMVWLLNGYLFLIKRQAQDRHLWVVSTGVAQRERAGLITPRSGVRITSPVQSI